MRIRLGLLLFGFLALPAFAQSPPARQVVITVDDLPKAVVDGGSGDINDVRATAWQLSGDLAGIPAIGFVNESRVDVPGEMDQRTDVLRMWLKRGLQLGNHGFSHLDFQQTPLHRFEDDVIRGEVITGELLRQAGQKERFFRYPYNHTGPAKEARDTFRQFLGERGYTIAPFTVQHDDYIFNDVYVRARRAWNSALQERVRAAYLDHLDTAFAYFEAQSRRLFGREIPQVFLIHANDLNADAISDILTRLRQRGYTFISLAEALHDPAYQSQDEYVGPYGISWLTRWALSRGLPRDGNEPDPPPWVLDLYNEAHRQ